MPSIPTDMVDISIESEKEKVIEYYGKYFNGFDLILDCIFGFSFEGQPREPFSSIITALTRTQVPLISVDVPSGQLR